MIVETPDGFIVPCICGETVYLFGTLGPDGGWRFQHGENIEHSIMGPFTVAGVESVVALIVLSLKKEIHLKDGAIIATSRAVVTGGSWIDAVHAVR